MQKCGKSELFTNTIKNSTFRSHRKLNFKYNFERGESCTVYSAVDAYDNNLPVAMKIIDVSTEYCSKDKATAISHDTKREVELLRLCSGHKNIGIYIIKKI